MGASMNLPEGFKVVSTPQPQGLPEGFKVVEQEKPQGMNKDDAVSRGWDILKNAWQGNAEFKDAGDLRGYAAHLAESGHYGDIGILGSDQLMKDLNKMSDASMLGNPQDVANAIKRINPKADIRQDESGNLYVQGGEKKFYFNSPGMDAQDVVEGVGNAVLYGSGGVAGGLTKNVAGRMALTGLTEGGINVAAQNMAGRDEIDKKEVALTAGMGAAAEGLTPIISKAWRWLKNQDVTNKEAGKQLAAQMGADLSDEQAERFGYMVRNYDPDQVTPETILQHVELNQQPTRGTLTKNQYTLDAEQQMRNSGRESVMKKFDDLDQSNQLGLERAIQSKGGMKAVDDYDAANTVLSNLRKSEQQAKQGVNQAYQDVGTAFARTGTIKDLPNQIKKALSDSSVILDPDNVPKANVALRDISKSIESLGDAKGVSWSAVDAQRRKLNTLFAGASPEDRRALTIVKNKYDDVVQNAFENDLLSGDPDVIKKIQKARGLASDYFNKYQKGDKYDGAGGIIDKWINSDASPEDVANGIINVHGNFNLKSTSMIKRLKAIAGDDSEQVQAVKDLVLQRMTRKLGEPKTREALRESLRKSLNGNKTLFDELMSPKEVAFLSRSLQFLDGIKLTGVKARSSGTMERLNRWVNMAANQDSTLSGTINSVKRALGALIGGENRAMKIPTAQVKYNPLTGAAATPSNDPQLPYKPNEL